ncbi:hypothetical protein [Deinococcus cellulosilyticus]|uniref:DNA-binding protein n=1 Tax=Deinococcus cellulosilyticus (strain DSM 18568 / NBRC 106333 / KACC 11606 / 5516J-15) TaxID=1223518 RepID=A0A511MVL3_DEIC1|nr:hypothetical protein [Deinococcus cellulosilyticus]GEM44629.1 hypothetical protein DC3_02640 [Deinococcus cellulosilyticus NBRC 106333 = KACC 11606]
MSAEPTSSPWDRIKGLSAPARRALLHTGITELDHLTRWKEKDLLALHGMGPKAVRVLKEELHQTGRSLA